MILDHLKKNALVSAHVFHNNNKGNPDVLTKLKYSSTADFLLDRARMMESTEPLTWEQFDYLRGVADNAGPEVFEPKRCYTNSMSLVLADTHRRMSYVEGYCYSGLSPVHHSWVLLDGRLVDLTRSLRGKEAVDEFLRGEPPQADLKDRVLGVIPDGWQYFGMKFLRETVRKYVCKFDQYGSLIDNYVCDDGRTLFELGRLGNFDPPDPNWGTEMMTSIKPSRPENGAK